MSVTRNVQISDLKIGNILAQDVMVGSQVLLRAGTELRATQILRINKLNLQSVTVADNLSNGLVMEDKSPAQQNLMASSPLPDFKDILNEDVASWMAGEEFNRPLDPPTDLNDTELEFASIKAVARGNAGLSPMMSPGTEAKLKNEVHAAYMSTAIKKVVNLEQVASAAVEFVKELSKNPDGFIEYTDIERFGQHLSAKSVLSCKIAHRLLKDLDLDLEEQFRGQLALNFVHVLLPEGMLEKESLQDPAKRKEASEALLRFYSWLRSQKFIGERTLEMILLQHEKFDGTGIPYGLAKEAIPAVSEDWAMSGAYASDMYSKPKSPRLKSREAADKLVGNAGKAFSSKGVNRFLSSQGYYPNGCLVELNDTRNAMVVEQNKIALLKPNVRPLKPEGSVGSMIELHLETDLYILHQVMEY